MELRSPGHSTQKKALREAGFQCYADQKLFRLRGNSTGHVRETGWGRGMVDKSSWWHKVVELFNHSHD